MRIKLSILFLALNILGLATASHGEEVILLEDFEGERQYTHTYEYRPSYYQDGTQVMGTTNSVSYSGLKAFGNGNKKVTGGDSGYVSIRFKLPAPGMFINRVLRFSIFTPVSEFGVRTRVVLDNTFFFGDLESARKYNNVQATNWDNIPYGQPNPSGWQHFEVPLPDLWGQDLEFTLISRSAEPQKINTNFSNITIDRIMVTGTRVSGEPGNSLPPSLLTLEQLRARLATECEPLSGCPIREDYRECVMAQLGSMVIESTLTRENHDLIAQETTDLVSYCAGLEDGKESCDFETTCAPYYQNGFAAGQSSVSIVEELFRARTAGFEEGVASVDQVALKNEGYQLGYREGVASIDQEAISKTAYEAGILEGQKRANVEVEKKRAYDSGYAAGKSEGCKVTICHKAQKKVNGTIGTVSQTLVVSINALKAHLAHGDTIGACASTKPAKR